MKLAENYYPCFLGNGLDAVLVGYSGSMVPEKYAVDRCAWYKSDRYYPEERLVKVAGRFPMDKSLEHAQGSGWYEIAPLGHTWYEVIHQGQTLQIQSSSQEFDPRAGLLHTQLDFGIVQAQVTTFLHSRESMLVEHYEFSTEVEFQAWMAPGVWVEEGWDTDPFLSVQMDANAPTGQYDLGETHGCFYLQVEPIPSKFLQKDKSRGQQVRGRMINKYFSILDDRQGSFSPDEFRRMLSPGYEALFSETVHFWQKYFSRSSVNIPDAQFQTFYLSSIYAFKAAQNRISGGLPVNNLRRTWSSHIFWDSYYLQRALLEANHVEESREACRFLGRTREAARRHAREEFGCNGLKWDWEITHDGRKAYGTLLHMKFQVHNNGSYANELWQHYLFTRDLSYLEEIYPLLEGLATFFLEGIAEKTGRGWEIGPLVGVSESPVKVKNEAMNLSATIVILEHCAEAAEALGRISEFTQHCRQVAAGLRKTVDLLYKGKYFVASEEAESTSSPSTGVIYPLQVIPFNDPRALLTSQAILADDSRYHRNGHEYNFPWSWGRLGFILACQGKADPAWQAIQNTRPTICQFGGMTEVMEDHQWNMQYFLTAQAAVVTAIHSLLLQSSADGVQVFPTVPSTWQTCSFEQLLAQGMEVSASYERGRILGTVRNVTSAVLQQSLKFGDNTTYLQLKPGEIHAFQTS